ncbi:alpha/beta fold hydrolase [Tsuneonella sp. HG249]
MIPPVLLIPGNMCDARLWRPVVKRLEEAGHTVCHAPRLDQDSIAEMAELVGRTIDGPAAVVGFSMGAIVAAELARRAPERVAALGLLAFNATADLPERAAVRPRQQEAVRGGQLETLVADELKPHYLAEENRGDRALLDTVMEMARALGPDAFIAQSEALRLRGDLRPVLPDFTMPVLLACGSEDRLCPPEWHRRWADMIGPNARLTEVPGAGHLLPLEKSDAIADTLISWLAEDTQCQTVY